MSTFANVPIERVRAYWNGRPCNVRHSPEPVGTRKYFDQVEERKYFVEPHIPPFADFARWRGKRVLEIGCGLGTDTINFARNGAIVTAVDLSDESLALARRRAAIFGLGDRITFVCANAEELSSVIEGEPYDLIYSFGVIHHTPHPDRVLDQAHGHLRPGGTLKLMVYHRRSWKVIAIVLRYGRGRFWRAPSLVAEHSEAQIGSPVTYTYSRAELRRLLERHGFRVTEMRVEHIFGWRVKDYVRYRYVRAWPLRALPGPLFRRLERVLGWHLCATAIKEASDA